MIRCRRRSATSCSRWRRIRRSPNSSTPPPTMMRAWDASSRNCCGSRRRCGPCLASRQSRSPWAARRLPEGAHLLILFASANDDEAVFDCPRQFDVDRINIRKSMTFGAGVHLCLGIALARMQLLVAARQTARRLGDISLAIPIEEIRYLPNAALLAMERLPLAFARPTTQWLQRGSSMTCEPTTYRWPRRWTSRRCENRYREERERRIRPEGQRAVRACMPTNGGRTRLQRPAHGSVRTPTVERGRRRRHPRRWLGRRTGRLPLSEGGRRELPNHRAGRRFRRRVVLESIPGTVLRQRLLLLPSASGGNGVRALEEVRRRP